VIRRLLVCALLMPSVASAAVHAQRVPPGQTIVIDGDLGEAAWADAPVTDDFVGVRPTEGFAPAGETTVRVLYDDQKLYFAWTCRFDEPTRVRAYLADREAINRDDQVAILIDPFGDGRRSYHFWINPLGVQQDLVVTLDGSYNFAWDTVFHSDGRVTDDGYVVEVAIPFRSLRFDPTSDKPWRVLLKRKFPARDEYVAHPPIRRDEGNELLQYTELVMDPPGTSGVGIELMPGVVGRTGWDRLDAGDDTLTHRPFEFPGTVDPSFGFKWLPTPSLTLDATVNPDFSQVEADPDQIDHNLRFALFLQEQRPFFLEGSELYDRHLMHTRSIRDPIYGVKFSGKVGGVGVGILHALDEAPASTFVGEHETPGFSAEEMEDTLAFNTIGGATVDLGRSSSLSVFYADKEVVRPDDDGGLEHTAAYRAGNAKLLWGVDDQTTVDLAVGLSHAAATGGDGVTGGRVLGGVARGTRIDGYGSWGSLVTPGYRAEMGFLTTPDRAELGGWAWRRLEPASGPVSWVDLHIDVEAGLQGLGEHVKPSGAEAEARATIRLPGLTDVTIAAEAFDELFGGEVFQGARAAFALKNDGSEFVTANVTAEVGDAVRFSTGEKTFRGHLRGGINLRLLRRVNLNFSGNLDRLGRPGETIDQLILYRVRAVVGFTRWLSLRFIAQGRRATVFDTDGVEGPASSALLLNALVRIEPSPGTALLLGWGQRFGTYDEQLKTSSIDLFAKASVLIRL